MKQKLLLISGLLILLMLILFMLVGCQPVKYIMVDPRDTTKLVEIRKRIIYEDIYMPLYFNNRPHYYNYPIRVPQRPIIKPNRGNKPPLPRPSRGKR